MDFVIVGGGVYGCGVAWELAQRGAEVLLLEAQQIAAGASGGGGKRGVRANGRDLRELPLMRLAYELWPELHQRLDHATGYERTGHLQIIERPRDLTGAKARAWMQTQQGIASHLLDAAAVRDREPFINEDVLAAIYCPNDGIADHTATTQGYAAAAQHAGVTIHEHTAVTRLEQQAGRVIAVHTTEGARIPVHRDLILLANSAVATLLQETVGMTLPVWSRLPQYIVTDPLAAMPVKHLIGHAHRRLALKALPTGQLMISGGWLGRWDEDAGHGVTVADQVAGNVTEAVALYPTLQGLTIQHAAADRLETESADGIPIIDRAPGLENLFFGVGWSGHGWAIAPAVVQLLAEWIFTGQSPQLLQPFTYRRFRQ